MGNLPVETKAVTRNEVSTLRGCEFIGLFQSRRHSVCRSLNTPAIFYYRACGRHTEYACYYQITASPRL